jgi:hypothetical protein
VKSKRFAGSDGPFGVSFVFAVQGVALQRSPKTLLPFPRRLHSYRRASIACEKPGFAFWCSRQFIPEQSNDGTAKFDYHGCAYFLEATMKEARFTAK